MYFLGLLSMSPYMIVSRAIVSLEPEHRRVVTCAINPTSFVALPRGMCVRMNSESIVALGQKHLLAASMYAHAGDTQHITIITTQIFCGEVYYLCMSIH